MTACLRLPPSARALIEADARAAWPLEACGLLIGTRPDGGDIVVSSAVRSDNVAPVVARAVRFEVDPALLLRLHRELRGTEAGIVGHYHSHPDGRAALSDTDRAEAWSPGFAWLVLALADGDVVGQAAFLHQSEGCSPGDFEPLRIVDEREPGVA